VFYGIRGENPSRKDRWEFDFELEDKDAIKITVCRDNSKYGIAITDNGGRLKKQDVLYWMHRQSARDDSGAPLGINDSHGRGFFIARRYIDRLIVNVAKNSKTEIIIINHTGEKYQGSKPMFINEI
jgi:anti-sigma regulatory factor (Ser/Thr protein kinase)